MTCPASSRKRGLENPYLKALREGTCRWPDFQLTQEHFFYAVTFFPRPMAALVGRIPDPCQRLDILRNLIEEHGDFSRRANFHHTTFQNFVRRLGVQVEALDAMALWPEVRAFNSAFSAACVLDELEVGVACMGMIEQRLFQHIRGYRQISSHTGLANCMV